MKTTLLFLHGLAVAALLAAQSADAQTQIAASNTANHAPNKSEPIPMDQLGAVAGKQYQGDGLSVSATPDGARLRCVFQRLEGQATPEGLWLSSTAGKTTGERFRVVAVAVDRTADSGFGDCLPMNFVAADVSPLHSTRKEIRADSRRLPRFDEALARTGEVIVADQLVRFVRPGLTEEYSVSMDGVRQDLVV